jgi:hypothetical protein
MMRRTHNEQPMVGFSIEGARLGEKQGMVVPRSIARKVTVTGVPANKSCVAEVLPEKKAADSKGIESLFKGELEIFKYEPSYSDILQKGENMPPPPTPAPTPVASPVSQSSAASFAQGLSGASGVPAIQSGIKNILGKNENLKKDSGMSIGATVGGGGGGNAGGGAFVGSQLAMSEENDYGMEKSDVHTKGWSKPVVNRTHLSNSVSYNHPKFGSVSISKHPKGHFEVKHNSKVVGSHKTPKEAGTHASTYMMARNEDLAKAMDAGSAMAAPSQLVGMAALAPESMDRKKMHKKEKSHWYEQAETAYNTWDKKNHFKDYMKKRMPHLAEGEIDSIGRVLALKKSRQAEGQLNKMYASHFMKSKEVEKGSDVMMASEKNKK